PLRTTPIDTCGMRHALRCADSDGAQPGGRARVTTAAGVLRTCAPLVAARVAFCRRLGKARSRQTTRSVKIQLMRSAAQACLLLSTFGLCASSLGCTREEKPDRSTFYERQIATVLERSCAPSSSQSTCHGAADDRGNAS